jgi:hypothetical protein
MPKRHMYARIFKPSIMGFAEIPCDIKSVVNFLRMQIVALGFVQKVMKSRNYETR